MTRKPKTTSRSINVKEIIAGWFNEISVVLQKPSVAVALFVLGIAFVIIASRQVKWLVDYIDVTFGYQLLDGNSVLSYCLALIVFFFVWLDIVLLIYLKRLGTHVASVLRECYAQMMESLVASAEKERARYYKNETGRPGYRNQRR